MVAESLLTLVSEAKKMYAPNFRPGEVVEVRDQAEILATLDEENSLEGLPFMPTMLECCSRKYRVLRRADKILVEGVGIRRMRDTVILEGVTCDGEAQGGCRRTCFILWKEAWLRRAKNIKTNEVARRIATTSSDLNGGQTLHFSASMCQSRSLMEASLPLPKWSIRRYLSDFTSGVYKPSECVRMAFVPILLRVRALLTRTKDSGSARMHGHLRRTPTSSLDLRSGDAVRVRSKEEILQTLDYMGRNRGLEFTPEMEKYCGETFRVLKRLDKMIVEQTGAMRQIANTVLLEGAFCDGKAHKGCPRNCYCLWREIWLRRMQSFTLQKPGTSET